MDLKARAKQLKRDLPVVFLCYRDRETPLIAKLVALMAITYGLSLIDLIPDFIPVLGYIDDIIILPILIAWSIQLIPDDIWLRNQAIAEELSLTKKWYYSIPIIVIWLIIIGLLITVIR